VSQRDVLQDEIPQQGRLAGTGFAKEIDVLALVRSGNTKRLGFTPAKLFTDADDWIRVVHGSKISRHSATTERPGSFQAAVVFWLLAKRRQLRWGQAGGVMAAGVEIRGDPINGIRP
jgi:hypothetical protein